MNHIMGLSSCAGCGGSYSGEFYCNGCQCFNSHTIIEIFDNGKLTKKEVSLIKKGDLVQTYNGISKSFTKVTKSVRNKGIFLFYELKCRDNASNIKNISLTENHIMIIFGKQKNEIKLKYVSQVKIGEILRTTEGFFEIFEISKKSKNECFEIRTEDGTIVANDILVSTLCRLNIENKEKEKTIQKILDSSKMPYEILN